ncbi:type II and III secretion system protein family protein [Falsiroseomonas oryziterrae]|uniref:type II and III secretion system protein family protein n=1 Tax=Falsiroseomonas oryziterrae TaxID=2911368 RepID=UPI001F25386E|nr:type II and III secretion system protein family protein [Roseomonas sp. NPKOSM-4]
MDTPRFERLSPAGWHVGATVARIGLPGAFLSAALIATPVMAQQRGSVAPTPMQAAPAQVAQAPQMPVAQQTLQLESGTGMLLQFPRSVTTVLAADPRVARVQPASPTSVFLLGGDPGRTTLIATAEDGTLIAQYEVTVRPSSFTAVPGVPAAPGQPVQARPSPQAIANAIRAAVPGASGIRVAMAGQNIVLSGNVATPNDAFRATAVAQSFAGDTTIINNIQILAATQVNLRVRVAEISRDITRELGFNWAALGNLGNGWTIGLVAPLGVTGGGLQNGILNGIAGSTIGGAAYRSRNFSLDALIDALARDQLVSILAEPNLVAMSGEPATFLAGGEFPVPVAGGQNGQLTVEFRQYGISLSFVPTVLSNDRLNLRVRPEVSELTDVGAVELPLGALGGTVRVPALTVRRAETTVELGSGQSFAIAGLLQRSVRQSETGIPGLQDSILGPLFRSDRFRRAETELVIIVTPVVVRAVSEPTAVAAPTDRFRPAIDLERILERRQIGRVSPARPGVPLDAGFIVD